MKSFAPPQKESKHIHASAADLLHIVIEQEISIGVNARSSHCRCSAKKNMFFKISQTSQETPVPEETPVNSAKFLRTPFSQNNSGRLLLKCGNCNNEAEDIDCICCRELDAMLIVSAKFPERDGSISPSSFYRQLPDYQSHVLVLYT